jgi:hypothetical protein
MTLQPIEHEFEERLVALDRDSRQAAVFAYTEFTIHHRAGSDFELIERLNLHAAFWNTVIGGLQGSAFVALGRMFDEDRSTYNIDGFLRYAETMKGIFSRKALEVRKVANGMSQTEARAYVADAWELGTNGLAELRKEFEAKREFFKERVGPIRHRVFAHAARITQEERNALFTGLFMRPLEELVVFTVRLHRAMFQLYHNGRQPRLDPAVSNIVDVMSALPERGVNSWEHLHAAKDAGALLDWIKSVPSEELGARTA